MEDIQAQLNKLDDAITNGEPVSLTFELEDADGISFEDGEGLTIEFVNEGGEEPNPEFATPVASLHRGS